MLGQQRGASICTCSLCNQGSLKKNCTCKQSGLKKTTKNTVYKACIYYNTSDEELLISLEICFVSIGMKFFF